MAALDAFVLVEEVAVSPAREGVSGCPPGWPALENRWEI